MARVQPTQPDEAEQAENTEPVHLNDGAFEEASVQDLVDQRFAELAMVLVSDIANVAADRPDLVGGPVPAWTVLLDEPSCLGAVFFHGHEVYRCKYGSDCSDPVEACRAAFAARLLRLLSSDL